MDRNKLLVDLFQAYFDARKHKRNTMNQMRFEIDFEKELLSLYDEIASRAYKISPSVCFIVNKPVKREIFAADFRDRVVHHLLYNYLYPVFDEIFIPDSYSCRPGKGTLYGVHRVEEFIRECSMNYTRDCYILKLDIRGYFMSIDKCILFGQLETMVKEAIDRNGGESPFGIDLDLLFYLLRETVFDDPRTHCHIKGTEKEWEGLPDTKSLFHSREYCGLPIGNLTSQLFSNVFLHSLDCFITRSLGFSYYGRYVDDFIIVHPDRKALLEVVPRIRDFLEKELNTRLHPRKIYFQHYSKGVAFLGAYIKPYRCYVSNRAVRGFRHCIAKFSNRISERPSLPVKEVEQMRAVVNSYLGLMRHFRTYNIKRAVLLDKSNRIFCYGYLEKGLHRFVLKGRIEN